MRIFFFLSSLLLVQAQTQQKCEDFSVGGCEIDTDILLWENDQVGEASLCQFACHTFANCKEFRYYNGNCQLFRDNAKSSCNVTAGRVDKDLDECILGGVVAGACDAFIDEECEYLGEDTGFSPPPGEITNVRECEDFCKGFEVLGCKYWVWGEQNMTCDLLSSSERSCWGISGPKDPELSSCRSCTEEKEDFPVGEIVDTQPPVFTSEPCYDAPGACACNSTVEYNMTAGETGDEIWRLTDACGSVVLSSEMYQGVQFTGSFQNIGSDDDWIGFVFGYQDSAHFYVVLAPRSSHSGNFWRLTKVASETGTETNEMILAILSGEDVPGQTEVLFKPDNSEGWLAGKVYTWTVTHKPLDNYLSLEMAEDSQLLWSNEWKGNFPGEDQTGHVGLFSDSQAARFFDLSVTKLCMW